MTVKGLERAHGILILVWIQIMFGNNSRTEDDLGKRYGRPGGVVKGRLRGYFQKSNFEDSPFLRENESIL